MGWRWDDALSEAAESHGSKTRRRLVRGWEWGWRWAESNKVSAVPSSPVILPWNTGLEEGWLKIPAAQVLGILSPEKWGEGCKERGVRTESLKSIHPSPSRGLGCLRGDWEGDPSFQGVLPSREPKNKLVFVIFGNPSQPCPHVYTFFFIQYTQSLLQLFCVLLCFTHSFINI